MANFDLSDFTDSDGFVLHFGGQPNEVDAYTFANSLVAISDAFKELNLQVNPNQIIELRLEAVGPGSFRGKLKCIPEPLAGALKWGGNSVILPLFLAFIYSQYLEDDSLEIEVSEEFVIISQDGDRVIIPREVYEKSRSLSSPERIHEHINRAIDAVEVDPKIESLGFTTTLTDEKPLLDLPRVSWENIREHRVNLEDSPTERVQREEVTLSILKAVFTRTRRKWEFVWRGVKVSAYIEDPIFISRVMQGELKIGNGDAIKCILEIKQEWSEENRVWLNSNYSITQVIEFIPKQQNRDFFES